MPWIYLDNNATTQPAPEVLSAMDEVNRDLWANPSSVHRFGQMVRQRIELARAAVARLINCKDRDLVFTSGGTESNNLALRGILEPGSGFRIPGSELNKNKAAAVLVTTKIEHSAIREPAEALARLGLPVVYVPSDGNGVTEPDRLSAALEEASSHAAFVLVSIQWANNETGVIQDVAQLAERCRRYREKSGLRVFFHCDATQAVGKIPVDVKSVPVDLLTFSAHKFHGPKGVGALYVRSGVKLRTQNLGGPQERERRGGTENCAGVIGASVAADLARQFLADEAWVARQRALRDRFEQEIVTRVPGTVINSGVAPQRLWNTTNLGFPRLEAEAILLGLSERGVCASAGAACSSGSLEPSPVLLAMGIPEPVAHGSLRFSISRNTTPDEIDRALAIVPEVVARLARTMPLPA